MFRRAAGYLNLCREKPADLPVQTPTRDAGSTRKRRLGIGNRPRWMIGSLDEGLDVDDEHTDAGSAPATGTAGGAVDDRVE
jgi:hypothetical protein